MGDMPRLACRCRRRLFGPCRPIMPKPPALPWGRARRKGGGQSNWTIPAKLIGEIGCEWREPRGPRRTALGEGCYLGGRRLAADGGRGCQWRLIGLPFFTSDLRVCMDGALGGGQQGVGSDAGLCGELTGASGLGLEAVDTVAVFVSVLVGKLRSEVARLGHLGLVKPGSAMG